MNYRHSFHAGNFADVHKHVTLLALLDYLQLKPKPFLFLDTHAGRGEYDLRSSDAGRGGEWQQGIGRLFDATVQSPLLQRYIDAVRSAQEGATYLRHYPGSPLLATRALRYSDRRIFVEKHPEECLALRKRLRQGYEGNTTIDDGDGYHALRAYLPPKEKRGLVLIDAPFEAPDEFQQLAQHLIQAVERWPTGMYCLWYPLKAGGLVNGFYAALKRSGIRKLLLSELWLRPVDTPLGLNGSGLIILNPPFKLDAALRMASSELLELLGAQELGGFKVHWLVGE